MEPLVLLVLQGKEVFQDYLGPPEDQAFKEVLEVGVTLEPLEQLALPGSQAQLDHLDLLVFQAFKEGQDLRVNKEKVVPLVFLDLQEIEGP